MRGDRIPGLKRQPVIAMESLEPEIISIIKRAQSQRRNALIIRIMMRVFMVLSIAGCLIGALLLSITIGGGLFQPDPSYTGWIILVTIYAGFFVLPFLFSLPVILPLAMRNRNVDRIVIFRKFNNASSKKTLRRIIRRQIGNYGHVFTLSDSNFRIKWYVRIPILLGQTSFFHFRPRDITNSRGIIALKRTLENIGWLNINWLLSSSKIFSVKTTDDFWQDAAGTLLDGSRLVIFDVSVLTKPLDWEANKVKALGMEQHVVVTAGEENRAIAEEFKARYDSMDDDYDIPLFYYNGKGVLLDDRRFEETIAGILAKKAAARHDRYFISTLKRALLTACIFIGLFMALLLYLSPYLAPGLPGRYSPLPGQAVVACLQANLARQDSAHMEAIRQHIHGKWPARAAALSIGYAYHHQAAECNAVAATLKDLADPSQLMEYIRLTGAGEPFMGEQAFEIVRSLKKTDEEDLILHLLANPRIDCKEKALLLVGDRKLHAGYLARFIDTLSAPSNAVRPPPVPRPGHATSRAYAGSTDSFDIRARRYYLDLYRLLSGRMDSIDLTQVKKKADGDTARDLHILFSLLLLDAREGQYLPALFDTYFIDAYYNLTLKEKNTIYFRSTIPHPFKDITDSMLHKTAAFSGLPDYTTLTKRLPATSLPQAYIYFLLKNYPGDQGKPPGMGRPAR